LRDEAVVGVVAASLFDQRHPQRMMKVIELLRVEPGTVHHRIWISTDRSIRISNQYWFICSYGIDFALLHLKTALFV
jgi:hypothetical protein